MTAKARLTALGARLRGGERRQRFAREVGGVVLGVLIALAAAEGADWLRWKFRVARSFEAVNAELAVTRGYLLERRHYQHCVERRLAAIGAILAQARQTGTLPAIASVAGPGMRPIMRTAFDVAGNEGVLLHTSRKMAEDYSMAYLLAVDAYLEQIRAELDAWTQLRLLEQGGGPVSDDLLTSLLQSWATASNRARWIGIVAKQGSDAIGELGIGYIEVSGTFAEISPDMLALARERAVCRPLLVDGRPFTAPAS